MTQEEVTEILYGFHDSPFGVCLIGLTQEGICHLSFFDKNEKQSAERIKKAWPQARLIRNDIVTKTFIDKIFNARKNSKSSFNLLIKGSDFQVKVWTALLSLKSGTISSYGTIARAIGSPKAVRAAATACGKNEIAFLIPCHRVLTSQGKIGGYRWGVERKRAMLAWESA